MDFQTYHAAISAHVTASPIENSPLAVVVLCNRICDAARLLKPRDLTAEQRLLMMSAVEKVYDDFVLPTPDPVVERSLKRLCRPMLDAAIKGLLKRGTTRRVRVHDGLRLAGSVYEITFATGEKATLTKDVGSWYFQAPKSAIVSISAIKLKEGMPENILVEQPAATA